MDVEWERKIGIKENSRILCLTGKVDLLLSDVKKTVDEADLGGETGVQFWTCYFWGAY